MKKRVIGLCVLVAMLATSLGWGAFAFASSAIEQECDIVFEKALDEVLDEQQITASTINISKNPLYDMQLDQMGFLYVMSYDSAQGYAIVVNTDGSFRVAEFYMQADNPYSGYEGKYIFSRLMTYLVWDDENFIDAESGVILDDETVAILAAKSFSTGAAISGGSETVSYTNKTANTYSIVKRHPAYVSSSFSNSCVPTAGANIIGFWTRYYSGLIPGFTPGSTMLGQYLYTENPTAAQPVIETLYYAMGTNTTGAGATVAQFTSGMNSYVSGKGRSISYSSMMSGGSFNYSLAKQKLESGVPLVLFMQGFRVDTVTHSTNQTTLTYSTTTANHAFSGFGYNEITYNLTNGTTRTDTYIQVATGLQAKPKGYYNIYYSTQIDECYAITIS